MDVVKKTALLFPEGSFSFLRCQNRPLPGDTPSINLKLARTFLLWNEFCASFSPSVSEMCGTWRFSFSSGKHYERWNWTSIERLPFEGWHFNTHEANYPALLSSSRCCIMPFIAHTNVVCVFLAPWQATAHVFAASLLMFTAVYTTHLHEILRANRWRQPHTYGTCKPWLLN